MIPRGFCMVVGWSDPLAQVADSIGLLHVLLTLPERVAFMPCSAAVLAEWQGLQNGLRLLHLSLSSGACATLTMWSTSVALAEHCPALRPYPTQAG
jgi:hypothetical protein